MKRATFSPKHTYMILPYLLAFCLAGGVGGVFLGMVFSGLHTLIAALTGAVYLASIGLTVLAAVHSNGSLFILPASLTGGIALSIIQSALFPELSGFVGLLSGTLATMGTLFAAVRVIPSSVVHKNAPVRLRDEAVQIIKHTPDYSHPGPSFFAAYEKCVAVNSEVTLDNDGQGRRCR